MLVNELAHQTELSGINQVRVPLMITGAYEQGSKRRVLHVRREHGAQIEIDEDIAVGQNEVLSESFGCELNRSGGAERAGSIITSMVQFSRG